MDIISRSAAGLPSPSVLSRKTTPWAGITWHHTGGSPTTWKAIHDWQTDGRPEADELIYIGYSYGIGVDGRVTELRGWDYRAAGDHDNSRLQVCFMGNWASKLPPQAALTAALEFARYAQDRAGKAMPGTAHRDVWSGGPYDTDCPGNALYAWVRANLTTIGDDDMGLSDAEGQELLRLTRNNERILTCFTDGRLPFGIKFAPNDPGRTLPNPLAEIKAQQTAILAAVTGDADAAQIMAHIDTKLTELRADLIEQIRAELPDGPLTADDVEVALRRVLGGVDGATPVAG